MGDHDDITSDELRLATRNHGMPLEALAYDVTPVGMHYLLTHYDVPLVDLAEWRLEIDGAVGDPVSLTMDDLVRRPVTTSEVTFECAGNGRAMLDPRPRSQPWGLEAVGTGAWTGTLLAPLLRDAGISSSVVEVLFTGLDRGIEDDTELVFQRSLPIVDALHGDVLLAWGLNGGPLPPQHGSPLRCVVPNWYGMSNVKWLSRITALEEPSTAYHDVHGYRLRNGPTERGEPLTRMRVRALMVPPGIPDFATRRRFVACGPQRLTGRAWSGSAPIEAVEVSDDGGARWMPADMDESAAAGVWRRWTFAWLPEKKGEYELSCRAIDAAGDTQPLVGAWNSDGFANNAVQRVPVTVR